LVTNGFNILDAEMNSIATAIYLGVSVTDHSCRPNAVATFEGTTLLIHATETIDCLDWSKIFISYIELLNTTEQRRHDLKSNYYFYCFCSKCLDSNELREMNAALCPNTNCNMFLDISADKCSLCKTNINSEYRAAFNEAMALTKTHLDKMKEVAYLDVLQICLNKQKDYLHPLNLWRVKTLDAAFDAYIEVGKWVDALEIGRLLIPGYRKYYGDWHPMLGLLHMKLGKIELYKNCLKEASSNLRSSIKILEITHGQGHSLVKEILLPLLMQATINFS
ncbi:histone-lysine N-methyltransferase SMYD3-like, partial [Teleopsis dalmanni]